MLAWSESSSSNSDRAALLAPPPFDGEDGFAARTTRYGTLDPPAMPGGPERGRRSESSRIVGETKACVVRGAPHFGPLSSVGRARGRDEGETSGAPPLGRLQARPAVR